ncbi:mitochondrial inner membrane protease subunit 2-like [Vigna umbellata]|uniref:mitochondrial inner membrane protease subunit 2-like n=1 Tax=Vigna umbellata TaxID=87088 RepID=UPI001F5F25EF|nr:mitochondrial inner membrane protease subunit 2-like [Vigna umbellata]
MGSSKSFLWNCTKKFVTPAVMAVTAFDSFATVVPVRGASMSPTLNPKTGSLMGNVFGIFLAEGVHNKILLLQLQILLQFCLLDYKFSNGDVVVFRSPTNHKETHIKTIAALPGEWYGTHHNNDVIKIPSGHCWVEGDNSASSIDSKSFGPIPLALIRGRVTHVVWPPQRIGSVKSTPQQRLSSVLE